MTHTGHRAFSLVEVVMAIGIFSFAVVAIFGLMSVGLRGGRESANDLALGLMSQTVSSMLRQQGFSSNSSNSEYAPGNTKPDFYFNLDGDLSRDTNGMPTVVNPATNYYACTVERRSPASFSTNALVLRLTFSWPMQAPETNRQNRVVLTTVPNEG